MNLIDLASRMMRRKLEKTRYRFEKAPIAEMDGAYGIYLNIPFCPTRCSYCPFYSETFSQYANVLDEYIRAAVAEIRQSRLRGKPLWLYVGGGTPNTLSPAQLATMLDEICKQVDPGPCGIELLPAGVNEAYLRELRAMGFSRISMGVQTFDQAIIRKTGRTYRLNETLETKIKTAQALGLWVSLDLMVGLEGQSARQFYQDIDEVILLSPNQVAIYPIVHVKGVKYGFRPSMSSWEQYQCIESINELMKQHGYQRRTAWIFARDNGDVYDTSGSELGMEYIGFGAGAYSVFGQWKMMNLPIRPYMHSIQARQRMAFVGARGRSSEDMRRISKMIYHLRLDDVHGLGTASKLALMILGLAGYSRRGMLTSKGRLLSHEISRAGMEALPFPIQDPSSVDNLPVYQDYCRRMALQE